MKRDYGAEPPRYPSGKRSEQRCPTCNAALDSRERECPECSSLLQPPKMNERMETKPVGALETK